MKEVFKQQIHKYCGGTISVFLSKEGYVYVCSKCKRTWAINVQGMKPSFNKCKDWRNVKKSET